MLEQMARLKRMALVLFGVLVLTVLGGTLALAMTTGGAISGAVTSPNGYPLPTNTVVKLFTAGSDTLVGQGIADVNDGSFSIGPVPNGLYVLKAVPPVASTLTQSEPVPVSVLGGAVSGITLNLTRPQIEGTVFAPDGTTPVTATVAVFVGSHMLVQAVDAPDGVFAIGGLPAGGYALVASPATDNPYWKSAPLPVSVISGMTQTVSLTLTDAQLYGWTKDSLGNPVRNAEVVAVRRISSFPIARASDRSSAGGFWAIGGLPNGSYLLGAASPFNRHDLIPPTVQTVTIPSGDNPYTLTFGTSQKIVAGSVMLHQAGTGNLPVQHALVSAHRVDRYGTAQTFTDGSGNYQMQLSAGLWAMTVKPVSTTVPANWVNPKPPQLIHFKQDTSAENKTQNFTVLAADATVIGLVILPGGTAVLPVDPFTVTVALFNNEGIGRHTEVQIGDPFTVTLPSGGYKVVVHSSNSRYMGPVLDPIFVPANGTYDLGAIALVEKDAAITGTVTDGSAGVEAITIAAWRDGTPEILRTESSADGSYILPVVAGDWHVRPAPSPAQAYLYLGESKSVAIAAGETVTNVDFALNTADATIIGVLVDETGNPVPDVDGWAKATDTTNPTIHNGAPIESGAFTIYVPGGTYRVAAHPAGGSPYMSAGERDVTVLAGGTETITLTVKTEDARIAGALWNPRTATAVTGVDGAVGAWWQNNWAADRIDPANGTYSLNVSAGIWHLGYRIDPDSNYVKLRNTINVPVASGQTKVVPLPVVEKDAAFTGTVLAPNGSPLAGALVAAHGIHTNVTLHARSADDGSFRLAVPAGRYRLGAAGGDPAWLNPVEIEATVGAGKTSGGHTLQFQTPDATLNGTLSISTGGLNGNALVWAWSEDGGFVKSRFPITASAGSYSLNVISGTVWHVGAAFETDTQFWATRQRVKVTGSSVTLNLTLEGPHNKPAPVVVTFNAADPQRIDLRDGTHIFIPAGAMPVTGTVTLRVVPIATLPNQRHAPNIYGYGYAMLATDSTGQPIESHFNQDVIISFGYDEAELARQGIFEPRLKPAYFSTTTNSWSFPDSYAVNMADNIVTMQIDHFTNFVLTADAPETVYLPLVMK